jgi:L-seryl-tRNA(Ser) seleniumtransferase
MPTPSNHARLPSVDRVLRELGPTDLPRPALLAVARTVLNAIRNDEAQNNDGDDSLARVRDAAAALRRRRIQPVINATGIIIHTNLGRSPLGAAAAMALMDVATQYSTLEYDLDSGGRGSRAPYLEHNLALLCGAEAATVVNNCAAALVLILRHFAAKPPRNQVVLSRGELVQIGGGFRIPDILEASGALLREIGTTNITTIEDYLRAMDDRTALVLGIHRSNFYMGGFASAPPARDIAAAARDAGVPFVQDLGSGATFDTLTLGGAEREPTPADALAVGADLVCFSGDKLLGGPQAGIIAGRREYVAALKAEPFFRALRCDKLVLAALEATVDAILDNRPDELPIRAMMSWSIESLRERADRAVAALHTVGITAEINEGKTQVGGGSLPRTSLPSVTVDLAPSQGRSAIELAAALRRGAPPVIAYISEDRLRMDLRTIFPEQDEQWVSAIIAAVSQTP